MRGVSLLRGGTSGYTVSKHGSGVEVRYSSVTMGTPDEYRLAQLARYAEALRAHGYAVLTDNRPPRLLITGHLTPSPSAPRED